MREALALWMVILICGTVGILACLAMMVASPITVYLEYHNDDDKTAKKRNRRDF